MRMIAHALAASDTPAHARRRDRLGQSLVPLMGQRHLDAIVSALPPDGRMLEWGLGGSTLYFARHLPPGATVLSVDHDPAWARRVQDALVREAPHSAPRITVRACPPSVPVGQTGTDVEEREDHLVQAFLDAPGDQSFDVILVDGWARNACLRRARTMLKPGGRVFLHDAQRPWYDEGKHGWVEHGHIGSCPEYPIAHLWWGGTDGPGSSPGAREALPLIVSFYTVGTPYEEEARHLIDSCKRLGLDHDIRGVPPQGPWVVNCAHKAAFISERWYEHRRPILWVDADGVMRSPPELLAAADADFAVHKRDGGAFRSGTIYFGSSPLAEELLGRWHRRCKEQPLVWDQVSLDLEWEAMVRDRPLRTLWLPASYCKVTGESAIDPVIEQSLASTRHRAAEGDTVRAAQTPHPTVLRARRASRPRTPEELAEAWGLPGAGGGVGEGAGPTQEARALTADLRDAHSRLQQQRDLRLAAVRRADDLRWRLADGLAARLAAAGVRTISLYGAGRHSELFTREPWASRAIRVVSVLDDAPRVPSLLGLPVMRPAEAIQRAMLGEAVVVSSDAHEPALCAAAARALGSLDGRVTMHAIYGEHTPDWPARRWAEARARWRDLAASRPGPCTLVDLGEASDPSSAVRQGAAEAGAGEVLVCAPCSGTEAAPHVRQTFTRSSLGLLLDRVFERRLYLGQLLAGEPRTHIYPPGVFDLENFDAPRPDVLLVLCARPVQV